MLEYLRNSALIRYRGLKSFIKCRCKTYKQTLLRDCKYVFIFFAADYNNLGDIAITKAQHRFLSKVLPEHEIIDVCIKDTYGAVRKIKHLKPENVLITLIGGGNNGTLYEFIEEPRRCVLNELKHYKIISFPQTVIYDDSERGKPYYSAFKRACKKCDDITLVARESFSYEVYKNIIGNRALLTPDIVFSLKEVVTCATSRENWVAMILRDDLEGIISDSDKKEIIRELKNNDIDIRPMDTCGEDQLPGNNTLKEYLFELSKARFAITDRLHGMIFCYITNTPCLVLDINNPKIRSTYDTWLKDESMINLVDCESVVSNARIYCNQLEKKMEVNTEKNLEEKYVELVKTIKRGS